MAGMKSSGRDSTPANGWTKAGSRRPPRRQILLGPSPVFEAWLEAYRRELREICEKVNPSSATNDYS
jgi:hypothetical protein